MKSLHDALQPFLNSLMSYLIIFLIAFSIIIGVLLYLSKHIKKKKVDKLPYKLNEHLLSQAELKFYTALISTLNGKMTICPKVGLKDFLNIPKGTPDFQKHFNKIAQKHIDFLICESTNMKPICGIELDDRSHQNARTIERDNFVEEAYKAANLPLVRYKVKQHYTQDDIMTPLKPLLNYTYSTDGEEVLKYEKKT